MFARFSKIDRNSRREASPVSPADFYTRRYSAAIMEPNTVGEEYLVSIAQAPSIMAANLAKTRGNWCTSNAHVTQSAFLLPIVCA